MSKNIKLARHFFVAGTDTDIGKTYVTVALLKTFKNHGYKTFGMKPIASGCIKDSAGRLINDDAAKLRSAANIQTSYKQVNAFAFEAPIAPHIAAKNTGQTLHASDIKNAILHNLPQESQINFIEGVGGWCVPINEEMLLSQIISALEIPVILVIGIKLGCLNHAILTSQAICNSGCRLVGWIANCIDNTMLARQENITTLKHIIKAPFLGKLDYNSDIFQETMIDKLIES